MAANPCISKVLFCSAVVDAVRGGGQVKRGSSVRANCRVLCFKVGLPRVLIVCAVRSRARIAD